MTQVIEERDVVRAEDDAVDFDVVLRGFDREQVRERVLQLHAEVAAAEDARLRALGEAGAARQEAARLRDEVADLRARLTGDRAPDFSELGDRVTQILQLAADEAAELRAGADADADDAVRTAREEADVLLHRAREAEETVTARLDAEREEHAERLAVERRRLQEEADELRDRTRRETDDARRRAEEDVEALADQRDAIADQLAELQARVATAVSAFSGVTGDENARPAPAPAPAPRDRRPVGPRGAARSGAPTAPDLRDEG